MAGLAGMWWAGRALRLVRRSETTWARCLAGVPVVMTRDAVVAGSLLVGSVRGSCPTDLTVRSGLASAAVGSVGLQPRSGSPLRGATPRGRQPAGRWSARMRCVPRPRRAWPGARRPRPADRRRLRAGRHRLETPAGSCGRRGGTPSIHRCRWRRRTGARHGFQGDDAERFGPLAREDDGVGLEVPLAQRISFQHLEAQRVRSSPRRSTSSRSCTSVRSLDRPDDMERRRGFGQHQRSEGRLDALADLHPTDEEEPAPPRPGPSFGPGGGKSSESTPEPVTVECANDHRVLSVAVRRVASLTKQTAPTRERSATTAGTPMRRRTNVPSSLHRPTLRAQGSRRGADMSQSSQTTSTDGRSRSMTVVRMPIDIVPMFQIDTTSGSTCRSVSATTRWLWRSTVRRARSDGRTSSKSLQ